MYGGHIKRLFINSFYFCLWFFPALSYGADPEQIKKNGVLNVCTESGYMPLEMKDSQGNWSGFDVDMMKSYAAFLGVKLNLIDTKWDGLIPSLLTKKCNFIASSMAKTPEREKVVAFTDSYYKNKFLIAMRNSEENVKNFKTLSDFDNDNLTIAIRGGTSSDLYLQSSHSLTKAKILKFDSDADLITAVLNSKADAFIYDTPYVKLAALTYPGKIYIIPNGFHGDDFAVAATKQDGKLIDDFNAFLKQWKDDGSYQQKVDYYFEGSEWFAKLK